MKKKLVVWVLSMGSVMGAAKPNVVQEGEVIANKVCMACHGPAGHSAVDLYPSLAGQHTYYLENAMKSYKLGEKGARNNPIMQQQMHALSLHQIKALAAYYSQQSLNKGEVLSKDVALGQKIYRGGIASKGIPACGACHGPTGQGLDLAGFPVLSGQQVGYTVSAIKAYRSGARKSEVNAIMNGVSRTMNEKEIQAVASYVAGLH